MTRRVIVYIDGFNLYHAIDDLARPHLKWLNVRALAEGLLREGEVLKAVKYFSAYATWRPDAYSRHRAYVTALRSLGVETLMASFKQKPRQCNRCKAKWMSHEEKETDVEIASHMLADALTDEVDRIILISADTDMTPAIRLIARLRPKCEVFVATPPRRFGLCSALKPKLDLGTQRLEAALLPEQVQIGPQKWIKRPASYAP